MRKNKSNVPNVDTNLRLDWCSYKAAKYAVEHWHYSNRMSDPKCAKVGVWENDKFIGVVIFSKGVSSTAISKTLKIKSTDIAELSRVALTKHISPTSKIVSIAIKMLKKKDAGLRLLISYADENQGHIGTIYQAGNWIFTGKSSSVPLFIDKYGKQIHDRSCSSTGFIKQFGTIKKCPNRKDLEKIKQLPKWRYYMPLDEGMKNQIEHLRQPYPKRDGLVEGQQKPSVDGGATPTPSPHIKCLTS